MATLDAADLLVGIDDTDELDGEGTGKLSRPSSALSSVRAWAAGWASYATGCWWTR